ncbi:MAG: signal peptidase II [Oscillospiraceae bacterium]|nr:signal peptidase II [Oscillospiraceae bacterium]
MLIISLILIISMVGCDQLIKLLVVSNYEECTGFIKKYYTFSIGDFDVFSLTHIRNDGAGWSILGGQTVFLIAFTSVIMVGILAYMIIKRKTLGKLDFICLSLIVAGGVGNLIDRVRMLVEPDFNGVIDYINFEFVDFPVFNFADMCVVVGAIGYCILMVVVEIIELKKKKALKAVELTENVASTDDDNTLEDEQNEQI